MPSDPDGAAVCPQVAIAHAKRCRLACAVGPKQREHFAPIADKINMLDNGLATQLLVQSGRFEKWCCCVVHPCTNHEAVSHKL
jgi:hypothetical protein